MGVGGLILNRKKRDKGDEFFFLIGVLQHTQPTHSLSLSLCICATIHILYTRSILISPKEITGLNSSKEQKRRRWRNLVEGKYARKIEKEEKEMVQINHLSVEPIWASLLSLLTSQGHVQAAGSSLARRSNSSEQLQLILCLTFIFYFKKNFVTKRRNITGLLFPNL